MSRRVEVHDLFREALEYGLAVIDGLEDDELPVDYELTELGREALAKTEEG